MSNRIDVKAAAKGAFFGGLAAGILNVGIYFLAASLGADFKVKDPKAMMGMEVLPFYQAMINCLIAAAVATLVVAVLARVAKEKAWTVFLGVAALVFAVEGFMSVWAFSDMATIVALEIMHIPATIGIVGGIYVLGVRPSRA